MRLLVLIYISLFPFNLLAWEWTKSGPEGIQIKMEVLSESVDVNHPLQVSLSLIYPKGYTIQPVELRRQLLESGRGAFSIVGENIGIPSLEEGLNHQTLRFELEAWDTGEHYLSFFDISFKGSDQDLHLYSGIAPITISANTHGYGEGMAQDILPINPSSLIRLNFENRQNLLKEGNGQNLAQENQQTFRRHQVPWRWIGLLALMLGISYLYYRYWRPRAQNLAQAQQMSPRDKALQALRDLHHENLPRQGEFDQFFVKVTGIVRDYIEEEYQIQAPERTTEEFLLEITQKQAFDSSIKELLQEFLFSADKVKFAKHEPSTKDCQETSQAAYHFVTTSN